jgi:amino acid permease
MNTIEKLIDLIIANFDFAYMITINVLTYIIIKIIDYINKDKNVKTLTKRIVLVCSILIVTAIYILAGYNNYTVIINSAICAPVFYSWVLRPILIKFNIGYKKYDDTLN